MGSFAVWAPNAGRVRVRALDDEYELARADAGWWTVEVPGAEHGTDYGYLLDDAEQPRPDPRSRWQPDGVHGLSRMYEHDRYSWHDQHWTGRQLPGSVIYELHIGTFTPAGTFDSAIERLDHLVELGVDLVEVLPVHAFNGEHNWGYDGVCWYAVHEPYGGPDGFKRFVDACHGRGLGVVVDAVYNHFGPSGAYQPEFGPYLTSGRSTWGDLLNLDGPGSDEVRRYIVDGALSWLRDYHVDGLRLDAVHALLDRRAVHLLEELAREVDALSTHVGRPLTLIAESDLNDPRLVTPWQAGGYGLHAQWDDDVHHALHVLLTGERQGYYADFAAPDALGQVLTGAFLHADTSSSFRQRRHGRPVDRRNVPGHRFVVCLQNHDQIGNRAQGDRLPASVSPGRLKVGAALLLTSPYTPMLFMGEEWAAGTPWQFFTSHPEPELAAAVGAGRREEFAEHDWPDVEVPDPQDPATFSRSKLDWAELEKPAHAGMLDFYRRLIALRKELPELSDPRLDLVSVEVLPADGSAGGDSAAAGREPEYVLVRRGRYLLVANLAVERRAVPLPGTPVGVTLCSEPGFVFSEGTIELEPETVAIVELAG